MKIDRAQVRHIARLARLRLDDAELDRYAEQLGEIVAYVEKLEELDLEAAEGVSHVRELATPFRPDEPHPSLERAEALANAPDAEDPFFRVPRVIE